MSTTTINRSTAAITDDDLSGTTGTIFNDAWYQLLLNAVDAIIAGNVEWGGFQTAPTQPRCVVYNSTTQSLSDSTLTTMLFDTEDFDIGGLHSTSVNTGRATCPSSGTGIYLVLAKVAYVANATGIRVVRIRKNGSDFTTQSTQAATAAGVQVVQSIGLAALTPGDYVEVIGFQSSGGALNTGDAASRSIQNELTVVKLW
jgi:hypothetical protein